MRWFAAAAALLGTACGAASPAAGPTDPASPADRSGRAAATAAERLSAADAALGTSDYEAADAHYRAAAEAVEHRDRALVGLARVALVTGRHDEVVRAASQVKVGPLALEAAALHGEALRREGRLDEAEAVLRSVERDPAARRARLLLGEVLLQRGRRVEAESVLMTLVADYNDDRITETDAQGLAMVGRAAHLLRAPRDANDAFNEAERAAPADPQTLLWRAELFLDKYDPGHAEEVTKEVLAKAPRHPEALVWLAHVKLSQSLDFDAAERLARKALAVNPKLAPAHFVLAGIALRDMEIEEADRRADAGLGHAPRDLDLLSMKAAIRFLADDEPGFAAAKQRVLEQSAGFTRMFRIIAEFADWEHRYDEVVAMMREAVRMDPDDPKAMALLGLNAIRAGDDAAGLSALQRAFDGDPFDVRVLNTLNLYEKTIPRDYVDVPGPRFRLRYHKDEKPVLERYVPRLLDRAWENFVVAYGFSPKTPVGVELYAERQNFAIRTSGLPNTAIQGVCFGQTLASMSPRHERFNLGMTLWHELAHVFHIQLSKSHVPRWYTEGLAEYETLVERPEWSREQDPALYEGLRTGVLPRVGSMNRAFTRAEDISDIATAYYASSRIVTMLTERHGRAKVREVLAGWGAGKRTEALFGEVFGQTTHAVDEEFRRWVKTDLSRYEKQFVPVSRPGSYDDTKARAAKSQKDANLQVRFALAALRAGKKDEAEQAVERALRADPRHRDARYMRARFAFGRGDAAGASKLALALVAEGADGYEVQMLLARVAGTRNATRERRVALEKAHAFDATQSEPIGALIELLRASGDDVLPWLEKLARLEEHEPNVHRLLVAELRKRGRLDEALAAGEAALWADIEGLETHVEVAEVLLARGDRERGLFELESAVLCPARPAEKAAVHARLAALYRQGGDAKASRRHAERATALGSPP